ncbi:nitroreductase [Paraburkholderia sp. Se-20369]|nr:nitroreductase [Paraburkholderia sp. Se-20369]
MLMTDPLALLLKRRSTPLRQLGGAAPDRATLTRVLEAAIRVPDHGKLEPFRLILLEGDAKLRFGERLAERALQRAGMTEAQLEKERLRYTFAPLVIAVIARLDPDNKIPVVEQQLSAGCVAYNLLLAATAVGLGAQWLTGWAAYDAQRLFPGDADDAARLAELAGQLFERSATRAGLKREDCRIYLCGIDLDPAPFAAHFAAAIRPPQPALDGSLARRLMEVA